MADGLRRQGRLSDPAPPVRILGNVYNVGTCGIVALLIAATARAHPARCRDRRSCPPSRQISSGSASGHRRQADRRKSRASRPCRRHRRAATPDRRAGHGSAARFQSPMNGVLNRQDPQLGPSAALPRLEGRPDLAVRRQIVRVGPLELTVMPPPATRRRHELTWRCARASAAPTSSTPTQRHGRLTELYRFSDHPKYVAAFRKSLDNRAPSLRAADHASPSCKQFA